MPGIFGPNHLYWSPDTNAAWLLAGCTLAFYRRSGRRVGSAGVPVAVAAIGAFWLAIEHLHGWYAMQIVGIAGYCILVGVAYSGGVAARLLSFAPLVWLGQISYSLYLWHRPILYALHQNAIVSLPVSLLVAWASYRYVEQPFRRRVEVLPPVAAAGHGSP
jgi:peptidoglycan/LPS O-acetylase OafA/YrhL